MSPMRVFALVILLAALMAGAAVTLSIVVVGVRMNEPELLPISVLQFLASITMLFVLHKCGVTFTPQKKGDAT